MMNNWLEGRQLSNFRVDEFLGRGGMAQVYRGWDLTLERQVAIKVIAAPYHEEPEYTARFLQEGRAMARWRHENIVQIYFAGQEKDIHFLVIEYVEGTDLKGWLAPYTNNKIPVPENEVLRIGKAVADALDYAHTHGIVHRDVKPSNILMAEDGRVLLTDFGLAIDMTEESSGEAFGSPKYIAPEQAQNSTDVVPQTDLYSLGIILYEMLTGSPPFQGGSATALAVQHINQAPPLPRMLNPALNSATEKVLLKSLSKSPSNRYHSGAKLMESLEKALNGEAETADGGSGPRTYSSVPVADKVTAHLSVSDEMDGEEEEGLHAPAPLPVRDSPRRKMLPVLGVGVVMIVLCVLSLLLASAVLDRIGRSSAEAGQGANGSLFGPGSNGEEGDNGSSQQPDGNGANLEEAAAPTVTLPGESGEGGRLVFMYNAGGFYAWNPGDRDITIRQLSFEAIDSGGNPTGRFFEARRWAGYYPAIQVGKCDRLEILNDVPKERPGQCGGYNAIMTPEEGDVAVFWLPQENVTQFRVLLAGQEIGRCTIADGQCEVAVP